MPRMKDLYLEELEEDLKQFENKLKILRTEYNQFFAGARKQPPVFTEIQVRKLIRKYAADKQLKGTHRFKFYNLIARFNTLREFWQRRIRIMEEGLQIGTKAHAKQGDTSPYRHMGLVNSASVVDKGGQRVIKDPARQQSDIRVLYLNYIKAIRTNLGDEVSVPFDKFKRQVMDTLDSIKTRKNCDAVRFRIDVKDGKVSLKAKPEREDQTKSGSEQKE